MAIVIKTYQNNGKFTLVNFNNIERICDPGSMGISYIPVYGNQAGGYSPMIASCCLECANMIMDELVSFLNEHESGVFDAHSLVVQYYEQNKR